MQTMSSEELPNHLVKGLPMSTQLSDLVIVASVATSTAVHAVATETLVKHVQVSGKSLKVLIVLSLRSNTHNTFLSSGRERLRTNCI